MTLKSQIRSLVNQFGFEVHRVKPSDQELETMYAAGGCVPHSVGYAEARNRLIIDVIHDPERLKTFRQKGALPPGYGVSFDERCIEYPWMFSQLKPGPSCVLDAGSITNFRFVTDHPTFSDIKLFIMTLAPEPSCYWFKGISYLYDDLRRIPMRDAFFDMVICVSTLEHIGLDNSFYGADDTSQDRHLEDFTTVMAEFRRVLKPGGVLLLTVPYGKYMNLGFLQQFDRQLLTRAIDAFDGPKRVDETFYRYTPEGWQMASAQDCAAAEFVADQAAALVKGKTVTTLSSNTDLAAAARAVACVKVVKDPQ